MRDLAYDLAAFAAAAHPSAAAGAAAVNDLIDTLACAAAGQDAEGVGTIRGLVAEWGGKPESGVWFSAVRAPAPAAALANGIAGHAVEFDDTHDASILHAGVTVIPAVLAAAERRGVVPGEELIAAIVVGVDVACRLAQGSTIGPGETGWLLTPLCGTFGAAAGAARALGLSESETLHALGIAYAQAAGNGQATIDGALTKRLQAGLAARDGAYAAIFAAAGLTGATNVFEGRRGYYAVTQRGAYERERVLAGLGERFAVEELSYKPYPCCRWTHAALEAALEARAEGLRPADVESIDVAVNRQAYNSTGDPIAHKRKPRNVVDAQFSIPFSVAAALVDGWVGLEHFTPEAIGRSDLLALAERVSVRVGEDWSAEQGRGISPARAFFRHRDGSVMEKTVLSPSGGRADSALAGIIREKFRNCCASVGLEADDAEIRLAAVESLPSAADAVAAIGVATGAVPAAAREIACSA